MHASSSESMWDTLIAARKALWCALLSAQAQAQAAALPPPHASPAALRPAEGPAGGGGALSLQHGGAGSHDGASLLSQGEGVAEAQPLSQGQEDPVLGGPPQLPACRAQQGQRPVEQQQQPPACTAASVSWREHTSLCHCSGRVQVSGVSCSARS